MKMYSAVFYTNDIDIIDSYYSKLDFKVESKVSGKFIYFLLENNVRLGFKKATEVREIPGHQTVFIEVEDIESLYNKIVDLKLNITKEITKETWATEFSILDPDKNKLVFRLSRL